MPNKTTIQCPKCGTQIDVNEILYHQLEAQMKSKFDGEVDEHRKKYKAAMDEFKAKEEAFKDQQEKFDEKLRDGVSIQLKVERQKLSDALKKQILDEQSESMALLQKELAEKSEQVKELNRSKAEIEQLKRAITEAEEVAKLKAEQVLTERLKEEKEKIHKLVDEQNELKLKEKDKQLEDQKKLIEEMKRKAEQGSMQLQGEVQELAIEEWLSVQFPFDTISEVKKGAFGADCLQIVHTREAQNCGVICYESKNTKAWSQEWIKKFKSDMVNSKADIGVLVTSVYPKEMDRMGFVEGVWVCSLEEFKGSVSLLRQSLITTHQATKREENRTDKMSLLYSYLTSNEFNLQLNSIVHGFTSMQEELEKEKRSLMASWKRRQKLIDGVLANTTEMYGSLQGIAGSAISHIEALELPYSGEDEEES
ncbi:MAG: DUF2130 domain-containing protein [Sulfuricurvum sp.]|uniref:DUF2130 domain-containing protein n=1 Tax=Sulfuricurvum sp. TaxID=2025608 RepID=UPI00271BAE3D|nr:DUF2130 domain-containing protein [Sulfuricurvum sp.]MDO9055638.1 DUF2130 domain-containing protein [Sulfuricurvum sp.]